jgi:hypothetical protein
MPRPKRQIQHCRNIAQKRKKDDIYLSIDEDTTDDEASDIEIEFIDSQIETEATKLFSVLKQNMETLKFSKRPLRNLGNSRTTKYRKKVKALESQKKNGQTLDQLLSKRETQELDNENLNNKKYIYQINQIENKLNNERNLLPGHKLRLKAVQHYLQLLNKGHAKLEASQVVADLLNRGKWFSRCIRSWSKAFILYNDVPKNNHGLHLKGSSIIEDEDIQLKIASYLRQNKFNININDFCDYVAKEILPSIGIEKKNKIR